MDIYAVEDGFNRVVIQDIGEDAIYSLMELGNKSLEIWCHDKIFSVQMSGYKLNDNGNQIPFIVCFTNKGDCFVIDEFNLLQIGGKHAIISNVNQNYIDDNRVCFNDGVLSNGTSFANYVEQIRNVNIYPGDENGNGIANALSLRDLYTTKAAINANSNMSSISNTAKIFNGSKFFYIEKDIAIDSNGDNSVRLFYAYENEESYKKGENPIAIAGEINMDSQYKKSNNFVNFVKDNDGNYVMLRHESIKLPIIKNYEDFSIMMNDLNLPVIPKFDLFEQRINNVESVEPRYFKSIAHMLDLKNFSVKEDTVITNYSANIDGVELVFDSNCYNYGNIGSSNRRK